MTASRQQAPKIEFPCDYPIKVMGRATAVFEREIVKVFQHHAPELDEGRISVKESRQGNYLSVTVVIQATGEPQLQALFADLQAVDGVKLVL